MSAIRGWWWWRRQPVVSWCRTYCASPLAAPRSPGPPPAFSTASPGPGSKRVGTHNGIFHCDEALGCFMIRFTGKFSGAEIVRTRDPQAIDAIDNGINQYDTDQPPKYVINTHLPSRVGCLNLEWVDSDHSSEKETAAFKQAMMLAGGEFLEDERSKNWRVHSVPVAPEMYESRRPLPQCWRGLLDDQLSEKSGIPGCLFVHISGFIGVNRTYEGALTMATTALATS
ncbi:hypothetical protein BHE74_00016487 [Ensete ventricosum]|uniref:Metal-dependent protein hydrolase n=1 Tax=Ensete ventricosum TaxID=4639 RepID=A0A445MI84_ENSVE|nr:hypothetical protein BHE74_00016487 [Ensete ventricosum]RZR73916.1 hypothetical protein BHM03_00029618 [Ensete ventricosum]